jgi:hypothetical protein
VCKMTNYSDGVRGGNKWELCGEAVPYMRTDGSLCEWDADTMVYYCDTWKIMLANGFAKYKRSYEALSMMRPQPKEVESFRESAGNVWVGLQVRKSGGKRYTHFTLDHAMYTALRHAWMKKIGEEEGEVRSRRVRSV